MQGVYQIRNKQTNLLYIGSSKDIETRWKQHKRLLKKGNHHSYKLQDAWNMWGKESFTFEILEEVINEAELINREQYYLDKYSSYEFGYNISTSANSKDYMRRKQAGENKKENSLHFSKLYYEEIRLLLPSLNTKEKAFLFSIFPYITYNDACLKHENGKPLTIKNFIEISGLNRSDTYRVIKGLIDKQLIYKTTNKLYFINPWLISKGAGDENGVDIFLMFKNYYININQMTWEKFYMISKGFPENCIIVPINEVQNYVQN